MRSLALLSLLCVFLFGCTKTAEKYCAVKVNRVPAYMWLAGFSGSDLNTVYVNRYSDFAFTQLQHSDTIISNGTNPTASFEMNNSYEVIVPATGSVYRIEKIVYNNTDSLYEYVTYGNCDRGLVVAPDSYYLNNVQHPISVLSTTEHYVILHK